MAYIDPFDSIVTVTKQNNRYYGPTESRKMVTFLSEVQADMKTIFDEINSVRNSLDVLASGYLSPAEEDGNLGDVRKRLYELEGKIEKRFEIQNS
jgi:hypothetical protein